MTPIRKLGRSVGEAVLEGIGRAASRVQETTPLPADVLENDEAYLVVFDTPGASGSDIQVRFRDGSVMVRIDRFREHREGFEMKFPGRGVSLDGHVSLPDDALVDAENARATLHENGTLHVRLPKQDGTAVTIETGDDAETSDGGPEPDAAGESA